MTGGLAPYLRTGQSRYRGSGCDAAYSRAAGWRTSGSEVLDGSTVRAPGAWHGHETVPQWGRRGRPSVGRRGMVRRPCHSVGRGAWHGQETVPQARGQETVPQRDRTALRHFPDHRAQVELVNEPGGGGGDGGAAGRAPASSVRLSWGGGGSGA